jgi:hypothetical protein
MNGFISYCHFDFEMYRTFRRHLRAIERAFGVRFWSDERISAGYHWDPAIKAKIETGEVFILLLSPAFIGSNYVFDEEIPAIQQRKKSAAGVLILPVVLERCSWQWVCGGLQSVPTDHGELRPIADWHPRRDGFDLARRQIEQAIQSYYGLSPIPLAWTRR